MSNPSYDHEIKRLMDRELEAVYEYIRAKAWSEMSDRERDVMVDRYVLNHQPLVNIHSKLPVSDSNPPKYSTAWEGMGLLLEYLRSKGLAFMENTFGHLLQESTEPKCYGDGRDHKAIGELMYRLTPAALAKASLVSAGIDVQKQGGIILMKPVVMERNEKTKLFLLTNNSKSILIMARYVDTKPEVQAEYLEFNGVRYNRWKEHGSFIQLVNKFLGSSFPDKRGDRKRFLENLYSEKQLTIN
jgi:hypothetical protein